MTKYENIVKKKNDIGPLDLTRQIGELQCENEGLKNKVQAAELETSLIKAVGMNSPEMKAAKKEITELKETLNSKDYFEKPDYKFLVNENHRLEQQYLEVMADNKRLALEVEDRINKMRKSGM